MRSWLFAKRKGETGQIVDDDRKLGPQIFWRRRLDRNRRRRPLWFVCDCFFKTSHDFAYSRSVQNQQCRTPTISALLSHLQQSAAHSRALVGAPEYKT